MNSRLWPIRKGFATGVPRGWRHAFKDDAMQKVRLFAALALILLAGCQSPAPVAEPRLAPRVQAPEPVVVPEPVAPPPAPVVRIPTASERALADGVGLYDAGDFNGAIKQLQGAKAIWEDTTTPGGLANKVAAHKYIAFSYCVTNRRPQCRQQFVDAIKLDPNFNLEPAEMTHPIWGPEFDRAKKQASAPPPPPPPPAKRPASAPPANPPKTQ